jgi:hypothetical protein
VAQYYFKLQNPSIFLSVTPSLTGHESPNTIDSVRNNKMCGLRGRVDSDDRIRLGSYVGTKQVDCYSDLKQENLALELCYLRRLSGVYLAACPLATPSRLKSCRYLPDLHVFRGPAVCGTWAPTRRYVEGKTLLKRTCGNWLSHSGPGVRGGLVREKWIREWMRKVAVTSLDLPSFVHL